MRLGGARAVVDRGHLGHADSRDDARCANSSWSDPDLDRIGAGVDQCLGRLRGRDVAGDHLAVPLPLQSPHHLDDVARMAVRRVDDENVYAGLGQRGGAVVGIRADTDRGADA